MAATSPVGKIAQVDPGKYVDEANNLWTGTKEAPVYGGVWAGPKPTNFVDVYGASPSAPIPPPSTSTPPPPAAPPTGPASGPTPPPVDLPPGGPGTIRANDNNRDTPPPSGPPPPTAPAAPSLRDAVAKMYRDALGREASPEEITNQLTGGQNNLQTIYSAIYSSAEAIAYAARRTTTTPTAPSGARPTGGLLTDPAYAAQYVAWAGTQPGVNPSVKNDPGYWIGRFTSGAFGNDQEYALQRMMQAEGAPIVPGLQSTPKDYDFNQARANVERAIGRSLSDADVAEAFQKFGGKMTDRFTDAGLAPVIAYFKSKGTGPAPTTGGTPAPTTGGPATGTTGPSSNVNSPYGDDAIIKQFREAIAKRLKEIGEPVDENAAYIREPLSAARNEASRTTDTERNALAERLYAQGSGLNTDALTRQIQQSGERNAVGLGGLKAQLITREYDARRQDLMGMLQQATASGDNASARAIQEELAALDATLKREGMGVDLAKYLAWLNLQTAQVGANG